MIILVEVLQLAGLCAFYSIWKEIWWCICITAEINVLGRQ